MTTTLFEGDYAASVLQLELNSKIYLSQIPWLEKHGTIKDLFQGKIAEIIQHQGQAKEKRNLFIELSKAVPCYLPAR